MSKIKQIDMTDDKWIDEFKPIPHAQSDSGYDCGDGPCLWETYGSDIEEVMRRSDMPKWKDRLWTVFDDGSIGEGYHYVNRLGYLFTEKAAEPNTTYNIFVEEYEEEKE